MSMIKTLGVNKTFGSLQVLKDVSLTVEQKEVVCIIGPSGAGKSTYLRSLNRLERIDDGKIYIEDKLLFDCVNGVNSVKMHQDERNRALLEVGMVFQRFNL
ncbi:MAG: ATP-binding cassette domain-containing protein, partial [Treponema sp.]|nr:ATP-binding cassette domain-containing protein [Treponema sp.]